MTGCNSTCKTLSTVTGTWVITWLKETLKPESESEVAQSWPTLCDLMDCSPPRSSVSGIFQARVLEWVAISFSRRSSWPRDRTWVSHMVGRLYHLQARILEWVAIPFSRDSSWPRDGTWVSCTAGQLFTIWNTMEAPPTVHANSHRGHNMLFCHIHKSWRSCTPDALILPAHEGPHLISNMVFWV